MNDSAPFDAARQARRISEQAVAWYIEQQKPLSERQRVAFLNWLRSSPRHVAEYFAVAQLHGDFKAAAALKTISAEALVEQAARDNPVVMFPRVGPAIREQHAPPPGGLRRLATRVASVAAAAAMMWFGVGYWRDAHGYVERSYTGAATAVSEVSLPDGTLVQLGRHSVIDVHYDGRVRRIAVIRGHALFDVGQDARRPLLVSLGGHVLQDIGTVFDVKRGAAGDTLSVISGRVRVLPALDAGQQENLATLRAAPVLADLTAGQQIALGVTSVGALQPATLAKVTAWLPSEIRFQHETIGNVARRFNAYTSKPLVIDNTRIAGERISGIFHADNPQAFAAYLASLPDVRVLDEGQRIRVVSQTATNAAHM